MKMLLELPDGVLINPHQIAWVRYCPAACDEADDDRELPLLVVAMAGDTLTFRGDMATQVVRLLGAYRADGGGR